MSYSIFINKPDSLLVEQALLSVQAKPVQSWKSVLANEAEAWIGLLPNEHGVGSCPMSSCKYC